MQLTIDSAEPLEHVLKVIGSLYGVELAAVTPDLAVAPKAVPSAARKRTSRSRSVKVEPAARKRSGASRSASASPAPVDPAAVRHWARENGHKVRDVGRMPDALVAAYRESVGAPS